MNKMKQYRTKKNLTMEQLGEASGTSKGHICLMEHGKIEPKVSTALKVARALKTTVERIWGDDNTNSKRSN